MNYLIVEPSVKSIAPNIALMKFARWCERNGHQFEYVRGRRLPNIKPDKIVVSCIFTYFSKTYKEEIEFYRILFPRAQIIAGGVFPTLMPEWFQNQLPYVEIRPGRCEEIEELPPKYSVDPSNKRIVLYASRGCPNRCAYCMVPKLEGQMRSFSSIRHILEAGKKELPNATGVVLYDNNFTAHEHFEDIVNELIEFGLPVDIHGLHVDSFTEMQAEVLSKLKWGAQHDNGNPYLRFSFDKMRYAKNIEKALTYIRDAGIRATFFGYL